MSIWDFIVVGTASVGMAVTYILGYNSAARRANQIMRAAASRLTDEERKALGASLMRARKDAGELS